MKKIKLIFTVFTLFLVSCSSEISGEYSGSNMLGDFDITLKEDGSYEQTDYSSGNSPFGVTGSEGQESYSSGTWKCDMESKKLWLTHKNSGRTKEYKVVDGLFGYEFKNSTYGSFD